MFDPPRHIDALLRGQCCQDATGPQQAVGLDKIERNVVVRPPVPASRAEPRAEVVCGNSAVIDLLLPKWIVVVVTPSRKDLGETIEQDSRSAAVRGVSCRFVQQGKLQRLSGEVPADFVIPPGIEEIAIAVVVRPVLESGRFAPWAADRYRFGHRILVAGVSVSAEATGHLVGSLHRPGELSLLSATDRNSGNRRIAGPTASAPAPGASPHPSPAPPGSPRASGPHRRRPPQPAVRPPTASTADADSQTVASSNAAASPQAAGRRERVGSRE